MAEGEKRGGWEKDKIIHVHVLCQHMSILTCSYLITSKKVQLNVKVYTYIYMYVYCSS